MKLFKVSTIVIGSLINGSTQESDSFYFEDGEAAMQILNTLQWIDPMLSSFRYNQYGCHCFQKGTNNAEFTGKGPAVDDIDRSCLKMHQCQRCLGIDSGRECNHNVRYGIERNEDLATGQRTVQCTDQPGSCARNLCECTVAFAYNIKEAEDRQVWQMGNLQNWGNFDNSICVGHGSTGIVHGAYTEVTAEELAKAMQAPSVEPVNVRARIMDMPDVQLKFAGSQSEPEVAVNDEINFAGGGKFFEATNDDVNVRARPTTVETASEASIETQTQETNYQPVGTIAQEIVTRGTTQTQQQVIATSEQATQAAVTLPIVTTTTTPEPPREMCCGSYSDHRFPYWSAGRGCCNGKTYDSVRMKCCNGMIKSIHVTC